MKKGRQQNHDMFDLLNMLHQDCNRKEVTNLNGWFRNWSTDNSVAQVLKGIDIVKKNKYGLYEWVAENPSKEMAKFVRQVTNEYKNYAV